MSKQKVVIISLGKPNAGKSSTWYEIFNKTIRTGWKKLTLSNTESEIFVKNSSFEETGKEINIDVFVKNASFEEYGDKITDRFDADNLPDIVFCSVQYIKKGIKTIEWFQENGYYLYIQWLNPGYKDKTKYVDFLNIEEKFKDFGEFHKVSGKEKEKEKRVLEIKKFLARWVIHHKLYSK